MKRFFYAGGTIPESYWDSYVTREADDKLYYYLKLGEFCYVLTARQMGKSSLCNRAMERLSKDGFKCVYIDLTQIGKSTANQWYYSISDNILSELDLKLNLENWWKEHLNHTPLNKFVLLIERILLIEAQSNIVIFIDEIDYMLSLNKDEVDTDEFFASIRGLYNKRSNNSTFERINFALFGVTAPGHLIQDAERTPFNIGKSIHLSNFSYDISKKQLSKGFVNADDTQKEQIFQEIFKWTNGHPYLTQFLCKKITDYDYTNETASSLVVSLIHSFLSDANAEVKSHFSNIEDRIINNKLYNLKMLSCYQSLLNDEPVDNLFTDATQIYLRLSGLVIEKSGKLVINNQIYKEYFNQNWLEKSFNKINPYYSYLKRWQEGGKSDKKNAISLGLLREYVSWAKDHQAAAVDWEFIHFSEQVNNKREKRQSFLRFFLVLTFMVLTSIVLTFYFRDQLYKTNVKLDGTVSELKSILKARNKEHDLSIRYWNNYNNLVIIYSQPNLDSTLTKERYKIDSLKSILRELQDSLSTINPIQGSGVTLDILYKNVQNSKEIAILRNDLEKCKNRFGDDSGISKQYQSSPNDIQSLKEMSVAVIPICQEKIEIPQIKNNSFYKSLVSNLSNQSSQKFISSDQILNSISGLSDFCDNSYKAIIIGRNLKASIVVSIVFITENQREFCNISFFDVGGVAPYAPDKKIILDKNDLNKVKNQISTAIKESLRK